ncbi:hypothetical protein AUC68_07525 [Methyloceanibacter methanicus]|uniref:Uncharacterized protein n=1 Tax=Methyloceanibacter methanicus TaxID=1774968 RepID=A0A1E3VZR3_9HYPH|nr:hypothetical protein AUC68_07525 [Methyloceanibacter methanicus]
MFSILWIALGGLSAYYLFTLIADPSAAGGQAARMAAPAAPSSAAPAQVAAAAPAGLSAEQLAVIDGNLQTLSKQLAVLDERLRPIENFIGPAAKLPPSNSVSTSPPRAMPKLEPLPKIAPVVSARRRQNPNRSLSLRRPPQRRQNRPPNPHRSSWPHRPRQCPHRRPHLSLSPHPWSPRLLRPLPSHLSRS